MLWPTITHRLDQSRLQPQASVEGLGGNDHREPPGAGEAKRVLATAVRRSGLLVRHDLEAVVQNFIERIPHHWQQNTMVTPVLANGLPKLQVPVIPWEHLIAFTALYCGLYMGGHTVKAIFRNGIAAR
jgi:hypothetical protein